MKKISIIVALLTLSSIIYVSCNKQGEKDVIKKNPELYSDQEIQDAIMKYDKEMESTDKSNPHFEDMLIADVVWNTEALLNAKYSWPEQEYIKLSTREKEFIVCLKPGDMVNHGNRTKLYQMVKKEVRDHFNAVQETPKQFHVVDMKLIAINGAEAVLKATSVIASNKSASAFDANDFWYWGWGLGKCMGYEGQDIGQDASTVLHDKTVDALKPNPFTPAQWFFYENVDGYFITYQNVYSATGGSCNDTYLFYHWSYESDPLDNPTCLTPWNMEWYYNGIVEVILHAWVPSGKFYCGHQVNDRKHFTQVTLLDLPPNPDPVYFVETWHELTFIFGNRKYSFDWERNDEFRKIEI
ncbi:MAG: hypothetical protein HY738_21570 [Bacteroidia bacterium]|nr:hypothetical protein [Bacteroidia bacterium]